MIRMLFRCRHTIGGDNVKDKTVSKTESYGFPAITFADTITIQCSLKWLERTLKAIRTGNG